MRGWLSAAFCNIRLVVFLTYFHMADTTKLSKITKKIINNQKNAKKRQKRPFLPVFRCFQGFLRYCSKTALTIFFILPGGEALRTGYLQLYVLYLEKFLFFFQFSCKDAKIGSFLVFFDTLKFNLEPPCIRKSLTNYWFWSVTSSRVEMKIEHGSSKPLLLLKKWHFVNYTSKNGVFWCFWAFWRSNLRKRSQDLATIY